MDSSTSAASSLKISPLWGSHGVLQSDQWLPIRGKEVPGGRVKLFLNGVFQDDCVAKSDGSWRMTLPPQSAGGPHRLNLVGQSGECEMEDILFGEVWLAAGQSNMDFPLKDSLACDTLVFPSPHIRFFKTPKLPSARPLEILEGGCWQVCDARTAADFSAVACFFACRLQKKLGVPVGILLSAWGGTGIQAWSPPLTETGSESVITESQAFRFQTGIADLIEDPDKQSREIQRWENYRDAAYEGLDDTCYAEQEFDDMAWKRCPVPGNFEEVLGDFDGAVWYRRQIEVPESWADKDLDLNLGVIDDLDHCFFDGTLIGNTSPEIPDFFKHHRRYIVPGSLVKPGKRVLAVRVFDEYMAGGFMSRADDLWLAPQNASPVERMPLAGLWRVRAARPITPRPMISGMPQMLPGVLFHGMIAPLTEFRIAGILWYQGESDCGNAGAYRRHFQQLIQEWRARWLQGVLPFHFVQLAGYGEPRDSPECSALADLREAQAEALALPATDMVTAIDLGEAEDIHPRNKRDVGIRLANSVLEHVYAFTLPEARQPHINSIEMKPEQIIFHFSPLSNALVPPKDAHLSLDCLYENGERIRVHAEVHNHQITLPLPKDNESKLIEVRHAWASNPRNHIKSADGMPLPPFRMKCNPVDPTTKTTDRGVRLAVRADDAGLTTGTNRAIAELCGLGVVRSVGILVVAPAFQDAIERFRGIRGVQLGLHFTLTCEWDNPRWSCVSPLFAKSGILDARGVLPCTTQEIFDSGISADKIQNELAAQFDRMVSHGIFPDYIDDHMGCSWLPGVADCIADFAKRKGVFFQLQEASPLPPLTDSPQPNLDFGEELLQRLSVAQAGDYLLILHPSLIDDEFQQFEFHTSGGKEMMERRSKEFYGMRSAGLLEKIRGLGVKVVNYSELLARDQGVCDGALIEKKI